MSKQAQFTANLSKVSADTVTVDYTTKDGSAVGGTDYTPTSGTLSFEAGAISKIITVPLSDTAPTDDAIFYVVLSNAKNGSLGTVVTGSVTIPGSGVLPIKPVIPHGKGIDYDRFDWLYRTMMDPAYGYFGPKSGVMKNQVPYHMVEQIIVEAPDWGQESVSETASFYTKMAAWYGIVSGDYTAFEASWNVIEKAFIPNDTLQPYGVYDATSPAQVIFDAKTIEETPLGASSLSPGPDPLAAPLEAAYNTKGLYLMHWLIDVDGVYGFKNGDGTTQNVMINNYQRGPVEDGWATITHHCWEDFTNGGGTYGFLPIYGRGTPNYPDASGAYAKQWSYSVAPDAESRAIMATYMVQDAGDASKIAAYIPKAKKMADYQRYAFFDKYFRPINGGYGPDGCHYLLSWGCGHGGAVPATSGGKAEWGFRIGNSEIHHGYNCVDVAYMCASGATSSVRWDLAASGANNMYGISVSRQLEFIRWLQSPEGPIAGGATSNYNGDYSTPTDGRETATFYGLYYNYSPSWHNPPSNNWAGYQAWSMERVARLYNLTSANANAYEKGLASNCKVILDKFLPWFYNTTTVTETEVSMVSALIWTEATASTGTATKPNAEGTYEYLPTLKWDSTGDYASFWSADSVPNPSLHCKDGDKGIDIGALAAYAQMVIQYCKGLENASISLDTAIPNTSITYKQCLILASNILTCLWNNYRDAYGFSATESLSGYTRMNDILFIPEEFGTGMMPDGSVLANGKTTFLSMRSFYKKAKIWPQLEAYLNGTGAAPTQKVHRFWQNAELGVTFGMMHKYYPDFETDTVTT